MDKLSSILGTSPRVKSVDLTDAHPVRPGTPAFGRPVGTTSIRDRFTVSENAKDLALQDTLGFKNTKESRQAKIAEDVTKKFFETRLQQKEQSMALPEDLSTEMSSQQVRSQEIADIGPLAPSDGLATESLEDFLQE
jgi:hypothetical protein